MLLSRATVRTLLLTALALPGCIAEPQATFSDPGQEEPTGGDAVGTPCLDQADCAAGLFCVATPCETGQDAGEPIVPEGSCGEFTCQLICASEGHLLCGDALSCCSGDLECNSRNRCVEPGE